MVSNSFLRCLALLDNLTISSTFYAKGTDSNLNANDQNVILNSRNAKLFINPIT
jgi:hypothetical protein